MGLPHQLRLRGGRRIRQVIRDGRRYPCRLGLLFVLGAEGLGGARLCLGFPRALGTAVVRNRARRRLQEAFRALAPRVRGAWDLVLRARQGAVQVAGDELAGALLEVLARAGVVE
ncbi:MAG: ribonuclease P protein component [Armatimonadetes bacterium]|nr:ribonuclease P protein component [Armatimonadota bacterium]